MSISPSSREKASFVCRVLAFATLVPVLAFEAAVQEDSVLRSQVLKIGEEGSNSVEYPGFNLSVVFVFYQVLITLAFVCLVELHQQRSKVGKLLEAADEEFDNESNGT